MKIKNNIFWLSLLSLCSLCASCKKDPPNPDEFYWKCTVDGQPYAPNNCTNCLVARTEADSVFGMNANNGYQSLGIGVLRNTGVITTGIYILGQTSQQGASFDIDPNVADIWRTDPNHTGVLNITRLDKVKKIVEASYEFKAYNAYRNDSVHVVGSFRTGLDVY